MAVLKHFKALNPNFIEPSLSFAVRFVLYLSYFRGDSKASQRYVCSDFIQNHNIQKIQYLCSKRPVALKKCRKN